MIVGSRLRDNQAVDGPIRCRACLPFENRRVALGLGHGARRRRGAASSGIWCICRSAMPPLAGERPFGARPPDTHSAHRPSCLRWRLRPGRRPIDPERKIIMVFNTMTMPFKIRLIPRGRAEDEKVAGGSQVGEAPPPKRRLNYYPQSGTPYIAALGPWLGIFRTLCAAPPWGQLSAVDLKTRRLLWKVTLGTSRDTGPFGLRPAAAAGDWRAKHRRRGGDAQRIDLRRRDDRPIPAGVRPCQWSRAMARPLACGRPGDADGLRRVGRSSICGHYRRRSRRVGNAVR